jgi:hypothetical protein
MQSPASARRFASLPFIVIALAFAHGLAHAAKPPPHGVLAVPTYESVGLYWSSPPGPGATGCDVRYRKVGAAAWSQALAMWYDSRSDECRGSIVNLAPDTSYEAELTISGRNGAPRALAFRTWPNSRPVMKVIDVPSGSATLNITEGGSPTTGYVVYQGVPGAVLDALDAVPYNIAVNASYVIVRALTLKGAQGDAIRISPDVTDVVIEDTDISGWGRPRSGTPWGLHMDSAIRAFCVTPTLQRVTIQRNRIHDPRYSANSWSFGNAAGPMAIAFSNCGGNHVIRHNDMFTTTGNYFSDIIGGEDNFSNEGSPYADSDIYGNRLMYAWDDAIEAEGRNMNVRIFGNYIDQTGVAIATTVTATGPIYIFRNVWNRNRFFSDRPLDQDERQPLSKAGSYAPLGSGRRYVFHNTMLQATDPSAVYTLGGGNAMGGTGSTQLVNNTISINNLYHLWKSGNTVFYQWGSDNQSINDMTNGQPLAGAMTNPILAAPIYEDGNGWTSESGGRYALKPGTPGYDAGVLIANFNDGYVGAAPDVGAHEAGTPSMQFASGVPTTYASGLLTSSANPVLASQSVTFTAAFSGSYGMPTGTVKFQDDTTTVPGCAAVPLWGAIATCTAVLAVGSHAVKGVYSGDATYGVSLAGPISQAVRRR